MLYLYAGLGFALFAGISSIFTVANTLMVQSISSPPASNTYSGTEYQDADRQLQELINTLDASYTGNLLCEKVLSLINESPVSYTLLQKYTISTPTPSTHPLISSACTLQNSLNHRILISPKDQALYTEYRLLSCILYRSQFCSFEQSSI